MKITPSKFEAATGHRPLKGDLDKANCPSPDLPGHEGCGWCRHDKPVWYCHICMSERLGHQSTEKHSEMWRRRRGL